MIGRIRNRTHLGNGTDIIQYCCPKTEKMIKGTFYGALGGLVATPFLSAFICANDTSSTCFSNSWLNYSAPICIPVMAGIALAVTCRNYWKKHTSYQTQITPPAPPQPVVIEIVIQPSPSQTSTPASITAAASSGLNLFPAKTSNISKVQNANDVSSTLTQTYSGTLSS